ncbi:MAG: NTP transferase domain-containing protein [Candidatus Omnitrophota bacterium]|nr:NTP transferase domain-containing protein [Candidatus Omnitrophota bacterium]MDZ4243327.1 NTP transferase domain-containing protein [Candidatus Omnitrophota bacterium]
MDDLKTSLEKIAPLYGLVLAGGKSERMKTDKAALNYHGRPQVDVAFDLLGKFCEKVFISGRRDQPVAAGDGLPRICDLPEIEGEGPLSGILSAMQTHPQAAWLVMACDLPYATDKTLQKLIKRRDPQKTATAYRSSHDGLPEPLCAIWEPHGLNDHLRSFAQGLHCPRKILINSNALILEPDDPASLDNVNTPEEFRQAKEALAQRKE